MSEESNATGIGVELARLVLNLALGLFAVFLFVEAGSLPASRWEPLGAGSFPRLVFAFLALLTALAVLGSVRRLLGSEAIDWRAVRALPRRWVVERRLVIALFALFGLYLAAISPFGFPLATLGFMLVTGALLAPRSAKAWLVVALLAVVFSYGLDVLFAEVFDVFLPRARGWSVAEPTP